MGKVAWFWWSFTSFESYAGMVFPLTTISYPHKLRPTVMISRIRGKKELFDYGSTILGSLHLLIICLKMSGMGKNSLNKNILVHWTNVDIYRWVLLEVLDKVSPGSVNWKQATKPPIKLPFRKVENCNQVVEVGKQLKLSLVNVAGNDIVQGNKKLIIGQLHFCAAF